MPPSSDDWRVSCVQSLPIGCVAFDPTNAVAATCAGPSCILYATSDGKRKAVLKHKDDLVSAFFVTHEKLVTITKCGDMIEWMKSGATFEQTSSDRVTSSPVLKAFYLREEERFVIVTDQKAHITVSNVARDKSLSQIAQLPAGLSSEQIAVTSSFVAYCSGKEVFVIPTDENPSFSASSYLCKTHIEGFGDRNASNVFVRITALGDTIAATLAIGRVYVWSHVSQKGIQDSAFSVHWHKVAPSIALTQFGGLLSAGAETVLCKFTLSGAGRPSMLPHLAAPVRDLAISDDASHLALILEDNSVHVVLTSSMTVLSSLQTVVTCGRSLNTIFCTDPLSPGALVMNGKPGSLQWIDCEKSFTRQQVHFSLENVADGDMSFTGITSTFPDVEQVFFSDSIVVTLERIINFEEEHKRLRFWKRNKDNEMTVQVLDSFIVPKDTISMSGPRTSSSDDEKIILSIMSSGKVNVWIPHDEGTRFKLDPTRHLDRRYAFHAGSAVHNNMWASAHPEGENGTDAVIVWDTTDMSEMEVLRTDGHVSSVEFDGKGHLICATDKSVRCWGHVAMRFEFLWVVEQALQICVSPVGTFAWSENTVIEFDAETAALKSSFSLEAPITDLVTTSDEDSGVLVIAKTEKGLSVAHSTAYVKKSEEKSRAMAKTPFAQLAPVESSSSQKGPKSALRPASKAAAIRLLDGPCHALPPISHIAPLFIAQCLAPPLQE